MLENQCITYLASDGQVDAHLFDSSSDCIKVVDLDGRLVLLNPGASSALELDRIEDVYGLDWVSLWPEAAMQSVTQAMTTAYEGGSARFGGFCPTSKGTPRWWDVIVTPMRNANGKIDRIMAVSRDVTELHLAKQELRNADRQKDAFLALLAHELRNPLSTAGMAVRLLDTPRGVENPGELGKVIARQLSHMSRLVEDLIDVSRVSRGLITLERIPLAMRDAVDGAIEQLRGAIDAKRQTLTFTPCEGKDTVLGDRVRLVQVAANLLGNASRYTPEGGRIDIAVRREGQMVMLSVSDSGIGIAAENIAEIFDVYSQVGRTSARNSSGLGLGLPLVRSLAALHDGQVSVRSSGPGLGSTFEVRIPASE